MKKLAEIFPDSFFRVSIKWHKPVLLDELSKLDNLDQHSCYLYKIVGKHKTKEDDYRLIYIGMTEKQLIHYRLSNKDHLEKQKEMKKQNRGYELYCSVGEFVDIGEKKHMDFSVKNVKSIENILIVSHYNYNLYNKRDKEWFSSGFWICIKNEGFLKDKMKKTISYGLFSD
jgi:hypothetical protein